MRPKPPVRYLLVIASALVGWTLLVLPLARVEPFLLTATYLFFLYSINSVAWNIPGGLTGLFSLGNAMFFGVGGFAFAHLFRQFGSIVPALLAAPLFSVGLVAVLMPAMRLRGPFFMLSTLTLSIIVYIVLLNWVEVSGGGQGFFIQQLMLLEREVPLVLSLAILISAVIAFGFLKYSYLGLAMASIRDDEEGAVSLAVPPLFVKSVAMVFSAYITGLAGAVHALYLSYVHVDAFNSVSLSLTAALTTILGGQGVVLGSIIGGLVNALIYFYVTAGFGEVSLAFYGLLLVIITLIEPRGVSYFLYRRSGLRIFSI
ncbi:MAG: branched-chain amino acid ABC transporter permease [Thaumarchaeota archaeon]|nr:branched-chain amino acid ABC transporter permease [Candidatus Calditenuaceae archaeon]